MSELGPRNAHFDLREEPDGILRMELRGDASEDMMREMAAVFRRMAESGREILFLVDLRRVGAIPASVRKVAAEEMRSARVDSAALVGASFSVRVLVTLTTKGVQLVTGKSYPLEFFEAEREARAWLLAQRDALRERRGPGA
ncbi:STAS/SEC14 domain-containing protein [Sorangium sp. So ce1036]|uniref:STAS/SEC14 domain-containing protein n=1 Tax=Sorangium sp. So ce1036 TaxID=3133328 RepID=UPI003F094B6F